MAKKVTSNGGKSMSIVDLLGKVDKSAEILADSKTAVIKEYINTGSYILNAAATGSLFKGIPAGRITTLAGEPATGKSYLALSVCREAQKMGYTPIYMDSEGSIDVDFVKRLGCDANNFVIKQVYTISEVSTFVANICRELSEQAEDSRPKVILVLDSLGNLTSDKEYNDTMDGSQKRDMTKQQEIKALFRVNATNLAKLGIPFIVNSHIYQTQDLFSKKVVSGGCLVPDEKIITPNGNVAIKDLNVGDYVLSENGEYEMVMHTFKFNKPTIKFTFEDGTTLETSRTHKFLTTEVTTFDPDATEDTKGEGTFWKKAENFVEGNYVREYTADKKYGWLKITKIENNEAKEVRDITVHHTHSYVTSNGVINHNSGIKYNSSVTLMLTTAKLDDKASDKIAENKTGEFTKTGVIVTATPDKSRFTIPQRVKFQIPFFKKPNPYIGLEAYLTWDNSGVILGKIVSDKEYDKMSDSDKKECHEMTNAAGEHCYAFHKDNSRKIVVKHLCDELPLTELWSSKVFTDELLHKLDEEVIRPSFELPSQDATNDLDEFVDNGENE